MSSLPLLVPFDGNTDDLRLGQWVSLFNQLKPHRATTATEVRARVAVETSYQMWLACDDAGTPVASLELSTSDLDVEPMLWFAALVDAAQVEVAPMIEQAAQLGIEWAPREAASATMPIVIETDTEQLEWWTSLGFVESERQLQVEATLSDATLPPIPARDDLVMVSLAERPDLVEAAYPLYRDGEEDTPGEGEFLRPDFARWRSDNAALDIRPEHELVLLRREPDGSESLVGYASMRPRAARPGHVRHGLTTIARGERGTGLGHAFKAMLLNWSYAAGFTSVGTTNHVDNAPMRTINDAVGFHDLPAFIIMRGSLPPA